MRIGAVPLEMSTGNQMIHIVLVLLDALDRHEDAAEQGSADE